MASAITANALLEQRASQAEQKAKAAECKLQELAEAVQSEAPVVQAERAELHILKQRVAELSSQLAAAQLTMAEDKATDDQ